MLYTTYFSALSNSILIAFSNLYLLIFIAPLTNALKYHSTAEFYLPFRQQKPVLFF